MIAVYNLCLRTFSFNLLFLHLITCMFPQPFKALPFHYVFALYSMIVCAVEWMTVKRLLLFLPRFSTMQTGHWKVRLCVVYHIILIYYELLSFKFFCVILVVRVYFIRTFKFLVAQGVVHILRH